MPIHFQLSGYPLFGLYRFLFEEQQ
jgi:hypothetical protein